MPSSRGRISNSRPRRERNFIMTRRNFSPMATAGSARLRNQSNSIRRTGEGASMIARQSFAEPTMLSVLFPPPLRAGESHVRGAKLLHWKENLILTVSPDSRGDCPGPLCRMLFSVGRSSEEPSTARSDRDAVHCVARHAVRRHDLLRHRAVWAVERSTVADNSGAGARDTESRHLQPYLSHPRSGQLRKGVSALYQGVCDDDQNQRRGSSRWQGSEKSLRTRPKSHAASDGDGV